MTSTARRLASFALLFVALLCACDLEIQKQELRWRYDAAKDELHVLFLHHGVGSPKPKEGADWIVRLLEGRRTFMLVDWPLLVDLDDEDAKDDVPPLYASARAKVVVDRVQVGVGASGWIDGVQQVRIRQWRQFLRDLDAAFSALVLRDLARGASGSLSSADPATQQLWRARAESGGTWFGWDAEGLSFDLPATPRGLALFARELLCEVASADEDEATILSLYDSAVRALEPIENGLRIRIGSVVDGGWSLRAERSRPTEGLAELRGALGDAGITLALLDKQGAIDAWHAPATATQR